MRTDRPRVRAALDAPPDRRAGRSLALIPFCVPLVLAALMLPLGAVPSDIPLPELDERVVTREVFADAARADEARRTPLAQDVRALGSAIREFNTREAEDAREIELSDARADINRARLLVVDKGRDAELLALRAVQMEGFLAEVSRFERTGRASVELDALGGTFLRRMKKVGWVEGQKVVLTDLERRAAFKSAWNTLIEVDRREAFQLSTMETRALYTLYFTHPHAPEPQRAALALARTAAKDPATCRRIDDGEHAGAQAWLLTKLAEYGKIDPDYPLAIARGVALYQRRQYADAAHSFGQWLDAHPNGPWTLRARNYLRASSQAEEATF